MESMRASNSLVAPINRVLIVAIIMFAFIFFGLTFKNRQGSTSRIGSQHGSIAQTGRTETKMDLPISFELNAGQAEHSVKYLSHRSGYTLYLTSSGATLDPTGQSIVRIVFEDSNPDPEIFGENGLITRTNYLTGDNADEWHTDIPNFQKVRYRNLYPGIDLVFYGNENQLEYDFIVFPGADPKQIRYLLLGHDAFELNQQGGLSSREQGSKIQFRKPSLYQWKDGKKEPVNGNYQIAGSNEISFQIESYDRARELIIDPVIVYSTYLGRGSEDIGRSIAVDERGNIYVTGETRSLGLATQNAMQQQKSGGTDVFIAKLNSQGSVLEFLTYLGGANLDIPKGIAVDSRGNAYIAGRTDSRNFPTVRAFQSKPNFTGSAFVSKLNPSGSALIYSTYLGGNEYDSPDAGIAVDDQGSAYVGGITQSTDFPLQNPIITERNGQTADAFLTKFTPDGSSLVYSTLFGGRSNSTAGRALVIDDRSI